MSNFPLEDLGILWGCWWPTCHQSPHGSTKPKGWRLEVGPGGRLRLLGLIPKELTSHRHSTKVTWGVHAIADSDVSSIGFDDCRKLLPQRKRQPRPVELTQGKSWGALVSLLCCSSAGRSCGKTPTGFCIHLRRSGGKRLKMDLCVCVVEILL